MVSQPVLPRTSSTTSSARWPEDCSRRRICSPDVSRSLNNETKNQFFSFSFPNGVNRSWKLPQSNPFRNLSRVCPHSRLKKNRLKPIFPRQPFLPLLLSHSSCFSSYGTASRSSKGHDTWISSSDRRGPRRLPTPSFGIFPLIVGTVLVTLGAMIFAVPLSIGCAIYISELAPARIEKILKPAIELLAGFPP